MATLTDSGGGPTGLVSVYCERVLFVGCLTSQQTCTCISGTDPAQTIYTQIQVADETFHLTQSQYTDAGPTSPSADPITPGAWQGKPVECQALSHRYDSTPEKSRRKRDSNEESSAFEAESLTTRPTRRSIPGFPGRGIPVTCKSVL